MEETTETAALVAALVRERIDDKMSANAAVESQSETRMEETGGKTIARVPSRTITIASALLQAGCLAFIFLNSLRVWLGFAAITAASGGSVFHSDPVRYGLAAISLVGAALTLGTVVNSTYLRNRQSARWRKRTLTRKEQMANLFSVVASLVAILLVWTELAMHHKLHPGK